MPTDTTPKKKGATSKRSADNAAPKKASNANPLPKTREPKHEQEVLNLSSVAEEMVKPTNGDDIREVKARIEEVFHAVGTDKLPGTVIPKGSKNNSTEAAEYALASHLRNLANDRFKAATEAAEKAGVFGDEADYVEGSTVMVYSDPNLSVNVKLGKPAKIINKGQLEEAVYEILGQKKGDELMERAMKARAPTKTIIVSMK